MRPDRGANSSLGGINGEEEEDEDGSCAARLLILLETEKSQSRAEQSKKQKDESQAALIGSVFLVLLFQSAHLPLEIICLPLLALQRVRFHSNALIHLRRFVVDDFQELAGLLFHYL